MMTTNNIEMKKHYLINSMKGFENYFRTRINSIESYSNEPTTLYIYMKVNPTTDEYISLSERVETIVKYDLIKDTYTIKCEGKGARKHNKQVKYDVSAIIDNLVSEAKQYYTGDCADASFMTEQYYYNQLKEVNASVQITNQFSYDCSHTFNTVEEIHNNFTSIMNELTSSVVLNEVVVTIEEIQDNTETTKEITTYTAFNRTFNTYDEAVQYCNESDFSSEYIEKVVTVQLSENNIINNNDLNIRDEVKSFIENIEYTTSLENIIKIQDMPFEEVKTMLLSHFERYKKISLSNEEVVYIINKLNEINASELLKDIHYNSNAIVELSSVNYSSKYLNILNESLERFITYASRYVYEQKDYGTVRSEYNKYLELAIHLRNNLHNIAEHVHKHCFNYDEVVYPSKMLQSLYNYRYFCYNNMTVNPNLNFNTLDEQNEKTRKYVHYDFSVKRIKTIA